ncbi:MAG: hypothetical protein PUA49_06140 [Butyrivibrio sp.]|nr:hypothetical protein [Butyrivibrio sp.]
MNKKARNEFIWLIAGLLMIIVATALFLAKAQIKCGLVEGNAYTWWQRCIVLLPLFAGIILMITNPHKPVPKLVAGIGVLVIIVMIIISTTIVLKERISAIRWIICILLWLIGSFICVATLVLNSRKRK